MARLGTSLPEAWKTLSCSHSEPAALCIVCDSAHNVWPRLARSKGLHGTSFDQLRCTAFANQEHVCLPWDHRSSYGCTLWIHTRREGEGREAEGKTTPPPRDGLLRRGEHLETSPTMWPMEAATSGRGLRQGWGARGMEKEEGQRGGRHAKGRKTLSSHTAHGCVRDWQCSGAACGVLPQAAWGSWAGPFRNCPT